MRALLRSPNRLVALALGLAFGAYGVLAVILARPFLGTLCLVGAAVLIIASLLGIAVARRVNIGAGITWLVLGYAGLFLVGTPGNILGMVAVDEVVLFAAATVHLAVGLGARRDSPRAATPH